MGECFFTCRGFSRGIAQSGSASGLGPEGREFKSLCPDHFKITYYYLIDMPKVIFVINPEGEEVVVNAQAGLSILEVASSNDIDLYGACGGSCACSTCHVIIDKEWYDKLSSPSDREEDILDMAFELTPTSRLSCQVIITEELDGIKLYLPGATRNIT